MSEAVCSPGYSMSWPRRVQAGRVLSSPPECLASRGLCKNPFQQSKYPVLAPFHRGRFTHWQNVGAVSSQGRKLTLAPTELPEPGPKPLGPLGSPHQLPVAFMGVGRPLKTAVSPLPTIQLAVMLAVLFSGPPLAMASPSPGDMLSRSTPSV